ADAAARHLYPEKLRLPLPDPPSPVAGLADRQRSLTWFDTEHAHLVAPGPQAPPEAAGRWVWLLADVLRGYLSLRAHAENWLPVARAGLAAARAGGDAHAEGAGPLQP